MLSIFSVSYFLLFSLFMLFFCGGFSWTPRDLGFCVNKWGPRKAVYKLFLSGWVLQMACLKGQSLESVNGNEGNLNLPEWDLNTHKNCPSFPHTLFSYCLEASSPVHMENRREGGWCYIYWFVGNALLLALSAAPTSPHCCSCYFWNLSLSGILSGTSVLSFAWNLLLGWGFLCCGS